MKVILIFVVVCFISIGCTHRDGYEAMQHMQKSECEKLLAQEYEKCMASMTDSYDEYREKRQEKIESD